MAGVTRVNGTIYAVTGGRCRVNDTSYEITGGTTRVDDVCYDIPLESYEPVLNDNSWSAIASASQAGIAASLWSVGDTKAVTLGGAVQRSALQETLWVYILGFDHNLAVEGSGIQFGCFLSAQENGVELCLADDRYGIDNQGAGYESMNFFTAEADALPWYQSRMRLAVLGSAAAAQRLATAAAVTAPASGTLMAALPAELRAVMQPITKYTDNGGVTATTEYLPLPSEKEVLGTITWGNQAEGAYQAQYAFYSLGLSTTRYRVDAPQTAARFWTRSPSGSQEKYAVYCVDNTQSGQLPGTASLGIAPVFKV